MDMYAVFCDAGLLNSLQQFVPTHRLARTCKRICEARNAFPASIQYTLTFAGTQRYLRSAEFREELKNRGIRADQQLRLRCQLDDEADEDEDEDDFAGSSSQFASPGRSGSEGSSPGGSSSGKEQAAESESGSRESGRLTKAMIDQVLSGVKEYELAIYTKSFPACLHNDWIQDWSKLVRIDMPRFFGGYYSIDFKQASNLKEMASVLIGDGEEEVLEQVTNLHTLYLAIHHLPAVSGRKPLQTATSLSRVRDLVVTSQYTLELNALGVLPEVRRLVVGFYSSPGRGEKKPQVALHMHSCCPKVVSLNMVLVGKEDLKPLSRLQYLRNLAIDEAALTSLPMLKLNRLCIFSSENQYGHDQARIQASTDKVVKQLLKLTAQLATLEELRLENLPVTNFEFTQHFPKLNSLITLEGFFRRDIDTTLDNPESERTHFVKTGEYGHVQLLKVQSADPNRRHINLHMHDF